MNDILLISEHFKSIFLPQIHSPTTQPYLQPMLTPRQPHEIFRNTSSPYRIWLQKWKIKVNETKSSHITFTLRKDNCPAISINQTVLPQVESVKYLGLHIDRRLSWNVHITKKRKQTDLTLRRLMSYIYGAPILDVSRSHTTTQHSR